MWEERLWKWKYRGRRNRGRPKRRWLDSVKGDLREKGLEGDEYRDRARWRRLVKNVDPA